MQCFGDGGGDEGLQVSGDFGAGAGTLGDTLGDGAGLWTTGEDGDGEGASGQ